MRRSVFCAMRPAGIRAETIGGEATSSMTSTAVGVRSLGTEEGESHKRDYQD